MLLLHMYIHSKSQKPNALRDLVRIAGTGCAKRVLLCRVQIALLLDRLT